jgi:predicted AlkP superfamily pyrophosphatase or phosphodiesterase
MLSPEVVMKLRRIQQVALAFTLAAPATLAASADSLPKATSPAGRVTNHVVIVSIDGLRPDAIEKFNARTLMRLMREGSFTLNAQTILPSKTLPSHTSMLTGVDADQHGITWNTDETDAHGHVDVPTVFGLAKERGFRTAAFFSKTKFHHLETPNSIDHVRSPKGGMLSDKWPAQKTVGLVEEYLESASGNPNLMFVHIGEPDYAGHTFGWMGRVYASAVREADKAVAEIMDEANDRFGHGNYTLIVTADHGGHDRNHGSADPRDTTIPWIVWGKGVQPGQALQGVKTMDTAATALWLLGVTAPDAWLGRPVIGAFGATEAVVVN